MRITVPDPLLFSFLIDIKSRLHHPAYISLHRNFIHNNALSSRVSAGKSS